MERADTGHTPGDHRRKRRLRRWLFGAFVLLLAVAVTVGLVARDLYRDARAERIDRFFDRHAVAASPSPLPLPAAAPAAVSSLRAVAYEFDGRRRTVGELLDDPRLGIHALVVLHDGRVALEQYRHGANAATRFHWWSVAKSVLSALVGIAIEEGRIASLDTTLSRYAPELGRNGFAGVTFREALAMSSGVAWREGSARDNVFVDAAVDRYTLGLGGRPLDETTSDPTLRRTFEPGRKFEYASVNSQAIAWALERATGRRLHELLAAKIWRPVGMEHDAHTIADGEGRSFGFCCLYATARDLARFGELYARGGRLRGRQIVPRRWVRTSTSAESAPFSPERVVFERSDAVGYGLHWWVGADGFGDFAAMGYAGQQLYVSPRGRVVVVRAGRDEDEHQSEVFAAARAIAAALGGADPRTIEAAATAAR